MFDDDFDGLKLCPVCRDRETTGDKCSACREQDQNDNAEGDDDDHEGQVYCPVCGGFGGDSYGSDSGTCEECGGSGYVDEDWGEGEDDDEDEEEE